MRKGIIILSLALVVIVAVALLFFLAKDDPERTPLNITESYSYNDFGFIKLDNLWITEIGDSSGTKYYIALHYGPKEIENITVAGNMGQFLPIRRLYVVFDAMEVDGFTNLAVSEFSLHMVKTYKIFQQQNLSITISCTDDSSDGCLDYPIMTCAQANETNKVVYLKKADVPSINIGKDCITIEGRGYDLIAATDNLMYRFYGIIR